MNTYRELVVGGILAEKGLRPEFEPDLDGKTPDWLIRSGARCAIVEVLTSYADQRTFEQLESGQVVWANDESDLRRFDRAVRDKCGKYGAKCCERDWGFIVAACLEMSSSLELRGVACALATHDSVFQEYPALSGVALYVHSGGEHRWRVIPNPVGLWPIESVLDPTNTEYELVLTAHDGGDSERQGRP